MTVVRDGPNPGLSKRSGREAPGGRSVAGAPDAGTAVLLLLAMFGVSWWW